MMEKMKTANNKTAKSITMPGRARRPEPKHQITQLLQLVRVEITPLTTWEAIADKAQEMGIWKDILPYAHFSIDLPIDGDDEIFLWQDIRELLDRYYHGKWDAKADWWHCVVVEAIFNHIMADMGYYMSCYEEKMNGHENGKQ